MRKDPKRLTGDISWLRHPVGPWHLELPVAELDDWRSSVIGHEPIVVEFENGMEWDAYVVQVSVPALTESRSGAIMPIPRAHPLTFSAELIPTRAPRLHGADLTTWAFAARMAAT